jgi:hypothetical protein
MLNPICYLCFISYSTVTCTYCISAYDVSGRDMTTVQVSTVPSLSSEILSEYTFLRH